MYENGIVVVYDEKGSPGHGVVTLPGWAAGDPQMAVALYLHGHRSYADAVTVVDWDVVEDVEWADLEQPCSPDCGCDDVDEGDAMHDESQGGVIVFEPGTVTFDTETGEFERVQS